MQQHGHSGVHPSVTVTANMLLTKLDVCRRKKNSNYILMWPEMVTNSSPKFLVDLWGKYCYFCHDPDISLHDTITQISCSRSAHGRKKRRYRQIKFRDYINLTDCSLTNNRYLSKISEKSIQNSFINASNRQNDKWKEILKDDMQRFFTKLTQKSFLAAYCNINPSV